jgi:endonuclease-3
MSTITMKKSATKKKLNRPAATPPTPEAKARAQKLYKALLKRYPDAHCELDFRNPHELLIATILSAQATDVGVNKATPALFAKFPTPADYAKASPEAIEPFVKSLGFFRMKSKAVYEAMKSVTENFGGEVPNTMDELLTLRGVARKTANVVLGNAFGKNEGVVVDTHVIRLANRMGLSKHADPSKIEQDLMALFPREQWTMLSHLLIWHGRRACNARNGLCAQDAICRAFCSNTNVVGAKSVKAAKSRRSAKPQATIARKATARKS